MTPDHASKAYNTGISGLTIQAMTIADPKIAAATAPLLVKRRGNIAIATLNRPAVRNALSEEMIAALTALLAELRDDAAVAALVIAANGPAFCAGHDLKQLTSRRTDADGGKNYFRHIMTSCSAMMQAIVKLPKPVIACVQGMASAAGCQLVATCDLAVASAHARFATPGVDIGLFCSTPMVALSRNIAPKQAMEMLLTGEPVTAERALAIGLVNRVVADGRELDTALALAQTVASKSRRVVGIGKEAFYRQREMSLAQAYDYAAEVMTENMMLQQSNEGICAFLEKREPTWSE
jgi:enoyl-CoA hydratase/carnithine racemase